MTTETADAEPTPASPRSVERLVCWSISGDAVPRERVGDLTPADPTAAARGIVEEDRITECFVLATCNRLEAYASGRTPDDAAAVREAIRSSLAGPAVEGTGDVLVGTAAVEHLARVTAGLESPILGEDEIQGQVGDAVAAAEDAGLLEGVVGRAARTAVRAGRRCRTETAIDEGELDYGTATVDLLAERVDEPDRIAVVGAGDLGRAVADTATDRWPSVRIDVANRTPARGRALATADGRAVGFDDLPSILASADGVVTATGADDPVIGPPDWPDGDVTPPVPIVDLATPPDVAPAVRDCAGADVRSLAAVHRRASDLECGRQRAVSDAGRVIDRHVRRFVRRERENRAEDTLRAVHEHAAAVREAELERARNRLRNGDTDPEIVLEEFASSFAGRLLGPPTDRLRTAAREDDPDLIRTARELFALEGGGKADLRGDDTDANDNDR